jgi:hypothetical protein
VPGALYPCFPFSLFAVLLAKVNARWRGHVNMAELYGFRIKERTWEIAPRWLVAAELCQLHRVNVHNHDCKHRLLPLLSFLVFYDSKYFKYTEEISRS